MAEKKKNAFLNYLKGLACLGVVICHVRFPHYVLDGVIQSVFRFAIPLFFMISGYFCDTLDREKLAKRLPAKCKHILGISLIGCGYYFLFQILIGLFGDSHGSAAAVAERLRGCFNGKALLAWVVFNQDPFVNIMWFTFALLYCYLLLWVINRFDWYKKAFFLIPLLIGGHMFLGNVLSLFERAPEKLYYRNFLFFGLPFVLLGVWIRRNQEKLLQKLSAGRAAGCMLTGAVLSVGEWFVFGRQEMFIGSILFAVGGFAYALHRPEARQRALFTVIGEKYSLFVYIVHYSLISVSDRFAYKLLPDGMLRTLYNYTKPIWIFVLSVAGAYLFDLVWNVWKQRRGKKGA